MKKYRDKSDFEINCEVMAIHGDGVTTILDYCNNKDIAMPLMIENKISIRPHGATECYATSDCGSFEIINRNPYRAAMEVFQMMKDAENEKV